MVLCTKEEPVIKAQAFALGANDYLVKLPDKVELIARIRYHSQAYINLLERDEAYKRLEESQRQLANELRAWATAPLTLELPATLGEALHLARSGMQSTFSERDAERVRSEAFEEAYEMVRRRSEEVLTPSVPQDAHLPAQASVVLRSEPLADVLGRQFGAMLGNGTAP